MSKTLKLGIMVLILLMLGGIYLLKSNSNEKGLEKQDNQYQTEQPNKASNEGQNNNSKEDNNKESTKKDNTIKETQKNMPALIDLGAGTCIPCKAMKPILDEVKKEYEGKAIVEVIDVYENRDETMKYGIRAIPTQIFFDASGKEVFRHEGYFSKEEIVAKFVEMGVK